MTRPRGGRMRLHGLASLLALSLFFDLFSRCLSTSNSAFAAAAETTALQRFALIIGANDGGAGREKLRYADSDARAMVNVLMQLGGVRQQDVQLLNEPTPVALSQALDQLAQRIAAARAPGRRIELLFYYSGHSDEQGLLLSSQRVAYPALRSAIERASADVTIAILDSCSAGAFTRMKGGVQRPPFLVDTSVRVSGHAFLASSSENEAAQESDRIGSSFFTYYLISGLRGAADVSSDGRVTLNEAYNFAFNETLQRTERTLSGAQHPAYDIQLAGTGDVVMTDLRDQSARLELPRDLQGRIYVRGMNGVLSAELTKHSGGTVILALEPATYRITVERDSRFYQTQLEVAAGRTATLLPMLLAQVAGERTVLRGGVDDLKWVPVNISIIPSLSINNLVAGKRKVINAFSFHVLSGRAASLRGIELGVVSNWRTEDALGLQFATALNVVRDAQVGMQLTMGVNVVGGDSLGIQFAGIANIVRGNHAGIAMSTALNLIGGQSWGFHLAGLDVVRGSFRGVQLGGLTAFSRGRMTGMQLAGGLSQAGEVYGVQFAFLNVGGDVHGAQIGFINVARTVHGAQIGFLNIAESVKGAAIGWLSFIKDGTHTLEVYGNDLMPFNLGTKLGSKRGYGILGAGIDPFRDTVRWSFGGGFGTHIPLLRNFYLDLDFLAHMMQPDITRYDGTHYHVMAELRLLVGWQILPRFGIFAGPTVHVSATNDPCCDGKVSQLDGGERTWQSGANLVRLGPGLTVGIRGF